MSSLFLRSILLQTVSIFHCPCRPFWLSPRQSIVVPVAPPFDEYAAKVSPWSDCVCCFCAAHTWEESWCDLMSSVFVEACTQGRGGQGGNPTVIWLVLWFSLTLSLPIWHHKLWGPWRNVFYLHERCRRTSCLNSDVWTFKARSGEAKWRKVIFLVGLCKILWRNCINSTDSLGGEGLMALVFIHVLKTRG